jgi:hypothetical protein
MYVCMYVCMYVMLFATQPTQYAKHIAYKPQLR